MNNTIQLYTDDERNIKGYPITTPDRVIDEKGKSIKRYLKNNVKFSIVGEGVVVPPINGDTGSNDNIINGNTSELIEEIETINRKVENIKNQLTRKADKDGSLQNNLNAQMINGKTIDQLALKSDLSNKAIKDGSLQTNLNAQKVGGKTVDELALKNGEIQENLNAEKVGGKTVDQLALKSELNDISEKVDGIDKDNIPVLDENGKVPASKLNKGIDSLMSAIKVSGKVTLAKLDIKKYNYLEIYVRCGSSGSSVLLNDVELTLSDDEYILQISSNGYVYGERRSDTLEMPTSGFTHRKLIRTVKIEETNTLIIDVKNYGSGYKIVKGYY